MAISLKELQALANNARVELEMSNATLAIIMMMGVFYIAITAIGVRTFNKCDQVQNSQKWKNIKGFLSHTMTMAITMIATLTLAKFVKSEAVAFGLVFGIFGLIASVMTISLTGECKNSADKSARNFGIASAVAYPLLIIASGYMMFKKRRVQLPSASYMNIPQTTSYI
jgi:hypothetical protein